MIILIHFAVLFACSYTAIFFSTRVNGQQSSDGEQTEQEKLKDFKNKKNWPEAGEGARGHNNNKWFIFIER